MDDPISFAERYFREWTDQRSGTRAERLALEHDPERAPDALWDLLRTGKGAEIAWPVVLALLERAADDEAPVVKCRLTTA